MWMEAQIICRLLVQGLLLLVAAEFMRLPLLKERLRLSPKLYYSSSKGPGFWKENNEEISSNNLRNSNVQT